MTTDLDRLKNFDLANATLTLWVFKKSYDPTNKDVPKYNGKWVDTSEELEASIKEAISQARDRITETLEYEIMAQNNESSALTISKLETNAELILQQSANETNPLKITKIKNINNSSFYSIKLVHGDIVIHCVRQTDDSWKTSATKGNIYALFSDEALELEEKPSFSISRYFDFFIVNETVLIQQKDRFESILSYKAAHIADFDVMKSDKDFNSIFSDMTHLANYVGTNKMQLRRAATIKQKQYYKNPAFINSLRENHAEFGLSITFDENGKIVPTPESCKDIFQALLDYRLKSHFSQNIYDVQNTVSITVN